MKRKFAVKLTSPLALFVLAALLAGGVATLAYMYLQKREETLKTELAAKSRKAVTPKVNVVVPRVDAPAKTLLNGTTFVSRPIDSDLVYPDTLLAKDFPSMQGLRLARPVLRGRPVRATDLQVPVVNDVAAILPAGTRAMTIDIDNLNSIAQTLRPNHRVDIFLIAQAPRAAGAGGDAKTQEQASLFMQDMVVLATGKEFQDVTRPAEHTAKMVRPGEVEGAREKGYDSITLLVKPAEAAKLMVGQKMGAFRVVLRGMHDRGALAMRPLTSGDLMPRSVRARDHGIEFIVGGRGENVVSRLAVPPSQITALQASMLTPTVAEAPGAASIINSAQPIPALRGVK